MTSAISASIGEPSKWGYLGDDGQFYTLASADTTAQQEAGDLSSSLAGDPIFPFQWLPRQIALLGSPAGVTVLFHVACNPTNSLFLQGPGATVNILGTTFTVTKATGERRQA